MITFPFIEITILIQLVNYIFLTYLMQLCFNHVVMEVTTINTMNDAELNTLKYILNISLISPYVISNAWHK